jgi:hypothetical protein
MRGEESSPNMRGKTVAGPNFYTQKVGGPLGLSSFITRNSVKSGGPLTGPRKGLDVGRGNGTRVAQWKAHPRPSQRPTTFYTIYFYKRGKGPVAHLLLRIGVIAQEASFPRKFVEVCQVFGPLYLSKSSVCENLGVSYYAMVKWDVGITRCKTRALKLRFRKRS